MKTVLPRLSLKQEAMPLNNLPIGNNIVMYFHPQALTTKATIDL